MEISIAFENHNIFMASTLKNKIMTWNILQKEFGKDLGGVLYKKRTWKIFIIFLCIDISKDRFGAPQIIFLEEKGGGRENQL